MAVKYYAVRKGIKPGIYKDWNTCKAMVTGFSGAQYKSFTTLQEAEAYIKEDAETAQAGKEPEVYAFVDGSFNQKTHVYGYGGFLVHDGVKEVLQGSGKDADMASMRNVAGEVLGSMAAIEKAVRENEMYRCIGMSVTPQEKSLLEAIRNDYYISVGNVYRAALDAIKQ